MAGDMFIKIDGIPGESTDDKHKGWIEISSFSFGVSQMITSSRSTSGGASGERCDISDFSFTKTTDKASSKLFFFCAKGQNIPVIEVSICHAAGDKSEYLAYKMEDCILSAVSFAGGGGTPNESVSINVGKITIKTTEYDHKSNKKVGSVENWWSTTENKGG